MLCAPHGNHHEGPMPPRTAWTPERNRGTPLCTCNTRWVRPHRPGSCSWPDVPGAEDDPFSVLVGGAVGAWRNG